MHIGIFDELQPLRGFQAQLSKDNVNCTKPGPKETTSINLRQDRTFDYRPKNQTH